MGIIIKALAAGGLALGVLSATGSVALAEVMPPMGNWQTECGVNHHFAPGETVGICDWNLDHPKGTQGYIPAWTPKPSAATPYPHPYVNPTGPVVNVQIGVTAKDDPAGGGIPVYESLGGWKPNAMGGAS